MAVKLRDNAFIACIRHAGKVNLHADPSSRPLNSVEMLQTTFPEQSAIVQHHSIVWC